MKLIAHFVRLTSLVLCTFLLHPGTTHAAESKAPLPGASPPLPGLLSSLRPAHPRLLVTTDTWERLRARRAEDALLDAFLRRGETEARAILMTPPVTYEKKGVRLLEVSRKVLRRVLLLAIHFHLTGDRALAARAEQEMLAAAAFKDWNPDHFLDTAEMTAALALGYDWLFDGLSEHSRALLETAMVEKGLRPGLEDSSWADSDNNWNQVCLSGLSLGALAIAEDEPGIAAKILELVKTHNPNGLSVYAPDGVYPEGPMYWRYGTSFQVVLCAALESALGTDWGLSQTLGFLPSALVIAQETGPTGLPFNFSDGRANTSIESSLFWFARKLDTPAVLENQLPLLQEFAVSTTPPTPASSQDRLLPLVAIWWPEVPLGKHPSDLPRFWYGRGPNPIAIFRDRWNDPRAMYLALKAGSASLNHAHMDAGSFVLEANGVRWAVDLDMQEYNSLEAKGLNLWDRSQDGDRWRVFRLNNLSHNTLTIDRQLHQVDGRTHITHFSNGETPGAIVDLSPVFAGHAQKVRRGFLFRPEQHLLIRDEIDGVAAGKTIRWAMVTRAESSEVEGTHGREMVLRQGPEALRLTLASPGDARFEIIPAHPPVDDFDAPNPDTSIVTVTTPAPASGQIQFAVLLQPLDPQGETPPAEDKLAQETLSQWPLDVVK